MKQAAHGGDTQTYIEKFGCEPLDFSANVNPLGISPLAKAAAEAAMGCADSYPDPYCRQLCNAIAQHERVPAEYILCGNGAADLIFRLVLAAKPHTALLCAPSFSEYKHALQQTGCEIQFHSLQESDGFVLTESILPCITSEIDILFLCEPNNPTGAVTPHSLLLKIAEKCSATGTLLVVDECFNGFLANPEANSVKKLLPAQPKLVIVKAYTKLYGMAGLRLGYAMCSNHQFLHAVKAAGQHWPVSSPAQAAGVAALQDTGYINETRQLVNQQRVRLEMELAALGCKVYPAAANYIFFYCSHAGLYKDLAQKGILVRSCENYEGLTSGFYRVAVRTPQENTHLVQAIAEVLGN